MQRKRKVVLFTLGVMLIAVVFICSWFRPEAVKERNLDFLKHEAAEFIRKQSADNISHMKSLSLENIGLIPAI